jgi:glycosyltransferase involved in cell wall biosynthesis
MIAVIATVLNEGEGLRRLLDSLVAQTRHPDEVVIVDGGSRDNTVAILNTYADRLPMRVFSVAGANISAGRNHAIRAAQADIIAATDAGVVLAPDWLEKLTAPLLADAHITVVGGFFRAEALTRFELAMGATVLPTATEVNPQTFLPSSRSVAFRKTAWSATGGYPEWLDYCEDLIFDFRLKATQPPFAFAPDALVDFRPRGSWGAFYKQYYRYARGDGKADLWRKRHAIRYLTYLVGVPLIALLGVWLHPLLWLLYGLGTAYYCYRPLQRLRQIAPRYSKPLSLSDKLVILALIPLIRVVGDVAKMIGYPVGWRWRRTQHPPAWQISRPASP